MFDELQTSLWSATWLRRRYDGATWFPVVTTRTNMGMDEQFTSDPKKTPGALDRVIRLAGQD